ncbi:MAG: permease [Bacteroidota bacterium]|nr:permease [Bacteroidota bacterium]
MKEWSEWKKFATLVVVFLIFFFLPIEYFQGWARMKSAVWESLSLARWYAREHVLLCLVPAFFIAGAITQFVKQDAVMKYLGPAARKIVAYPVAAVSGTILAVCSCTVLPLFASIHKRGAGLGPASAFLYSGPAINVLAIILTARVLGLEIGAARAIGAVVFSIVIGLLMHLIFRNEEKTRINDWLPSTPGGDEGRTLWQNGLFFAAMVGILVFANWGKPAGGESGFWAAVYSVKWVLTMFFFVVLGLAIIAWFRKRELSEWVDAIWMFTKQIMPLLLVGVLVAGFLLGGPGSTDRGIIPSVWIQKAVGGNSILANAAASVVGAFMYFATLTEVPILQGLMQAGMGKGPALALLLAGPALSLPSMLAIGSILGTKKTVVFVLLVVVLSTITGFLYGSLF